MYLFTGFFRCVLLLVCASVALHSVCFAAVTNSWVPTTSGDWHVAANWSLGTPPNSSQSVRIESPGWKAVAITPATSANFPASLTVSDLTIRNNSTQDVNTLLLNYAGTATPLRVLNGLSLQDGARIVNFNSGLIVEGGIFAVANAEVIQDGGLVRATNGTPSSLYLQGSAYYLTNGTFEAGNLLMGIGSNSVFQQYGGSATIQRLTFADGFTDRGGTYLLAGGHLTVPNLSVMADNSSTASFIQSGGTNIVGSLTVSPGLNGGSAQYILDVGFLVTSNTRVFSTFKQSAGAHNCAQELSLEGEKRSASSAPRPGSYILTGGQFSTPSLVLRAYGSFNQSNGLTSISGTFQFGANSFDKMESSLAGGTLACSNILSTGGGADFVQTGGSLIVTNLFFFGGTPACCSPGKLPSYTFSGGTITASNMQVGGFGIGADFIVGSSALSGRITNPGYFALGGNLHFGNASEQLGRLILQGPSSIDFGPGNATVRFAPSGAEPWGTNVLRVLNWAGSAGGGGSDQLRFGNNASGLSAGQLQQIAFSNPAGLPPGDYPAQILSTGEIVPAARASLSAARSGDNLVLNWPAGWTLQSATNVLGPYLDVTNATPPYTNQFTAAPQRYFRLRNN